jgi:DNA modification methylase
MAKQGAKPKGRGLWKNRIIGRGMEDPAKLMANPFNFRRHGKAQAMAMRGILGRIGWVQDIVVNKRSGHIVDGHLRNHLAIESKEQVPVVYVDLSPAEEKLVLATFDPIGDMAQANDDQIAALIAGFSAGDAEIASMVHGTESIKSGNTDPDDVPSLFSKAISVPGDVWILNDHRIMCGNSREKESVRKLLVGNGCDLCFTSPPYGAGKAAKLRDHYVRGANKRESFYVNHDDEPEGWKSLMQDWRAIAADVCDVIVSNIQMLADNKIAMIELLYEWREELCDIVIWDKGTGAPQMQQNVMNNAFEFVFIHRKSGASRSIPFGSFHGTLPNIVRINPKGKNSLQQIHRAVMPVDLALWALRDLCSQAQSVYDPFLGSGTTLIAAEQTGRRCYAMEIDPLYIDLAIRRWQEFTGKNAISESTGKRFPG